MSRLIVIDGRCYSSEDVYRLEMGEQAFARSAAASTRRTDAGEQLGLIGVSEYRTRTPTIEELYERERSRG